MLAAKPKLDKQARKKIFDFKENHTCFIMKYAPIAQYL